jgi:hypothetical protein
LLLPESLALVLLLLHPNLAAEPFAAAAAVVVDVVGAAHVGVVADAGNAKREAGAGAVVVLFVVVVAVVVVDDDDSKCVAAGDWGGCEPRKAREKSHERARKADEVQEDAASCPTETVGPHSLHTAPEIASSISLSLLVALLLLLFFKILHTITMCWSFKLRYTCTYFTLSLSMHQINKQSYSAIIAASIAAAAPPPPPPPPPPLPTPPPPPSSTPSHFLPFFITIISQSDAATTPSHLLRLPLFSIISINISQMQLLLLLIIIFFLFSPSSSSSW